MTQWHLQSIRFMTVGLASNLVLFVLYLLLTTLGVSPKLAMTILFAMGAMQTFIFNKRWTFAHRGLIQASFSKYVAVYSFAYLLNLTALLVLVDNLGYPHQVVQGVMILSIALMLFVLQKFWVFRAPGTVPTRS
jgi:putative flippase GtrA